MTAKAYRLWAIKIEQNITANTNEREERDLMRNSILQKWRIYIKERFPISFYLFNAFLLAMGNQMFLSKVMKVSLDWKTILLSTIFVFIMYFLIRVVDEFKDYEEDCIENPERPVQRGVISLDELSKGVIVGIILLIIYGLLVRRAVMWFAFVGLFFFLMSKEFFIAKWLNEHPRTYVISHGAIVALMDFYMFHLYGSYNNIAISVNFLFLAFECVRIFSNINQDYFERCYKEHSQIGKWMIMHFSYLFLTAGLLGWIMLKCWGVLWIIPVLVMFLLVFSVYIWAFFVKKDLKTLYKVSQLWFAFCFIILAV